MAAGAQRSSDSDRDVLVTGIGLVSSLGEGLDVHWAALTAENPQLIVDETSFAPYTIHPICDIDYSKQGIAKGDLRQMGDWQRIGTYAAGLALDDAGLKGQTEILERMHIIAAAGNGERDTDADRIVLEALKDQADWPEKLNELLLANLRPTLYLGQQSQLLAGNIAIVHKVTGGSRTYKGEEMAGVQIFEDAVNRIRSGQNDIFLVGAAYNAARWDQLLIWGMNGRADLRTGSMGAFLVLESRGHAEARGAKVHCKLSSVGTSEVMFVVKSAKSTAHSTVWTMGCKDGPSVHISGLNKLTASGNDNPSLLTSFKPADTFGHGIEVQFPLGLALSALLLSRSGDGVSPTTVSASGMPRFQGMAVVEKAET